MELRPDQLKAIQTAMSSRCSSREERLDLLSDFFKTEILSTKDLTETEAREFLYFLNTGEVKNDNWGIFDKALFIKERKLLWSYLYQAGWTVPNGKHGEVPDTERLSNFIKSSKSPVNKPLKNWDKAEWEKMLAAFLNIVKFQNK